MKHHLFVKKLEHVKIHESLLKSCIFTCIL
nr:MAG TPA: hypothetical protein [Caudoviricetes sp.]